MKQNKHKVWRFLYKLHRYTGLLSALVIVLLSVTGIILNHTEDLKLDSKMVSSTSILDWYGIKAPESFPAFATKNHWISQINEQVYFDKQFLLTEKQALLGVVETPEFIVVAFKHSLLLLSPQAEIIEQTAFDAVEKIGLNQQQAIAIKTQSRIKMSDDGLLSWQDNNSTITWSDAQILPETLANTVKEQFRSSILPVERLFLDLHSGRFFGYAGVIIVDISGLFLIILSLSGSAIWLKHRLRKLKKSR